MSEDTDWVKQHRLRTEAKHDPASLEARILRSIYAAVFTLDRMRTDARLRVESPSDKREAQSNAALGYLLDAINLINEEEN